MTGGFGAFGTHSFVVALRHLLRSDFYDERSKNRTEVTGILNNGVISNERSEEKSLNGYSMRFLSRCFATPSKLQRKILIKSFADCHSE